MITVYSSDATQISQVVSIMSFTCPKSHVLFSYYGFLVSFSLEQVLSFSLTFVTLLLLKVAG